MTIAQQAAYRMRPVLALLPAIALGAALRWHGITTLELQYDEAATGYFASLPWTELWGRPAVLEPNPPLFYSMAKLVLLAGGGVEEMRHISALAGTLCIPVAWLIGRLLAGRFVAGAAAWLVATSPQHIALSQYARTYAALTLCLLCAMLCLIGARRAGARAGPWWAGYAAVSAASLYLHHSAIPVLAGLALAALATSVGEAGGRRVRAGLLAACAAAALAYAPWLPVLVHQAFPAGGSGLAATGRRIGLAQRLAAAVQNAFPFEGLPWVDAWLLPVVAFGAWRFRASRDAVLVLAACGAGLLLMVVASQLRPMLDGKTLGWAGLVLMPSAALGLHGIGRVRWVVLAVILLAALDTDADRVRTGAAATREGWRDAAAVLRQGAEAGDVLFINDAGAILALRHYGWPEPTLDIRVLARPDAEPWFRGAPGTFTPGPGALSAAAHAGRTWLLTYNAPARHAALAAEAEAASRRRLFAGVGRIGLSLFAPDGQ